MSNEQQYSAKSLFPSAFFLHNAALLMRGFLTLPLGGVNQGKGREETGEREGEEHRTQSTSINTISSCSCSGDRSFG